MSVDKRKLRVEFDHPQRRVKRGRIGFTVKGFDFLDGILDYCWVNPTNGILQVMPNSENPSFQTSNSGAFAKLQLSDVTTLNNNASGSFEMMAASGMHVDSAIHFTGAENTLGIGVKTTEAQEANQGYTLLVYAYGSGTDQDGVLIECGWANTFGYTSGVSVRVYLDGRVEIWRNGAKVGQGSLSGGGYQPGTVRGASYERATDEFVMVRIEPSRDRYLTITSSKGGVFNFACPWATGDAPEPILPANQFWWYQPVGGGTVVAAPIVYATGGPFAVSAPIQLSEAPGAGETYTARTISHIPDATVTLVAEDGVTAYDPTQRICRVKVVFGGPAFIQGVTGYFPPITAMTPDETVDVTEYVLDCPLNKEDSPDFGVDLVLRGDAPVPFLTEAEGRPVRVSLVPHDDDEDPLDPIVMHDAVAGPPEWTGGLLPEQTTVRIKLLDRLSLAKEAFVSEPTPFDGLPISKPYDSGEGAPFYGDSLARMVALEAGLIDSEMSLADLDFTIADTPPQRAGEWNFASSLGDRWADVLERGMGMVPEAIYGIRPRPTGVKFEVVDTADSEPSVLTFYRTPEAAALDPHYIESELGGWAFLYGEHERTRLPREGNLCRVTGYDPALDKGLQSYISDDDSRNPASAMSEGKLGFTRTVAYSDPALTTEAMVDKVTESLYRATAQKQTCERWRAFLRWLPDGSPLWRGDRITLEGSNPDGTNAVIRIAAFQCDLLDESGQGLKDDDGDVAPIPVRVANYTGGALVGLGGSSLAEIRARQKAQIDFGELRKRGFGKIPHTSMVTVKSLPIPT